MRLLFLDKKNGGKIGIRTLGTLTRTPVFKTGALNQLDHLSTSHDKYDYINENILCQHFLQNNFTMINKKYYQTDFLI